VEESPLNFISNCGEEVTDVRMDNQFVLLMDLQRLDTQLHVLHAELRDLPQRLQPYETVCTTARQALLHLQENLALSERKRRALERELDGQQVHLDKTQSKLHEVKTNKEYQAVLAEIETAKHRLAALEEQVLDLMELIEQHHHKYREQEKQLQAARHELDIQNRRVQQDQKILAERSIIEEAKRQQLVSALDAHIYGIYQRLTTLRDGQVVVFVQNGTCSGCYLKIQPQLVSEIRRQDKLILCPHCQRMLLWPSE
jgi:predicted  nucleic acid-binding Zn-ribbon protein